MTIRIDLPGVSDQEKTIPPQEGSRVIDPSRTLAELRDLVRHNSNPDTSKKIIGTPSLNSYQADMLFSANPANNAYFPVLNSMLTELKQSPLFQDYTIAKLDADILKGTLAFRQSGGDMERFIANMKKYDITGRSVLPILMILGQWGGARGYNFDQLITLKNNPTAGSPQPSSGQIFSGAHGEILSGKPDLYKAICTGWHMLFEDIARGMGIQTYTLEAHMNTNHLASMYKMDGQFVIQTWSRIFVGRTPSEVLMQYNRAYNSTNLVSRVYDRGKLIGDIKTPESTALQSHISLGITSGETMDFDQLFQGNISTTNTQKTSAGNITAKTEQLTADTQLQSAMVNFRDVYHLGETKITTVAGIGMARLERAGIKLDMITSMAGFDAKRDLYKGKDGLIYVRSSVLAQGFLADRTKGDVLGDSDLGFGLNMGGKYTPTGTAFDGGVTVSQYISPTNNITPKLGPLTIGGKVIQDVGSGKIVVGGSQSSTTRHIDAGYVGKIGDNTTLTLSGSSDIGTMWINPETRHTFSGSITHDFRSYFIDARGNQDVWLQFCKNYGIDTTGMDVTTSESLQIAQLSFVLANSKTFLQDTLVSNSDFIRANITLEGGKISINPDSLLSKYIQGRLSIGVQAGGSMNNGISLGSHNYIKAGSEMSQNSSHEGMIYADWSQLFARYEIKANIATNGNGDIYRGVAHVESGRQFGQVFTGGAIGIEKVTRDGVISGGTVGMSTLGPTIGIRDGSILYGGDNQEIQLSLGGLRVIMTKTPGKTIVDERGETLGQFEWMYQFLSKSPADRASIKNIMNLLSEIGSKKTITISEDFARELRSRSELKKFETYLKNNQTLFVSNSSLRSIHFESTSDWLGSFRGAEGVEMTPVTGHALIRSLGDGRVLSSGVLTDTPSGATPQILSNSLELLREHQIHIKSDYQVTDQELGSINHLIQHALSAQQGDRIKNITIRLESKTEGQTGSLGWDEKKRVLTIPRDLLQFVPPEQVLAIENTASGDQQKALQSILTEYEIHNLNTIEVVPDNDARFLDLDGNQTMLGVKNRDGKTYAYKSQIERMILLSQKAKTPDGLGFFEKREFDDLIGQWKKASIYPLDQFDLYLNNKMSDLKKSTAKMARYAGVSVLQGFVPKGAIEYIDGAKTLTLIREQTNTKEKIGEVRITLNANQSMSIQTSNIIDGTSQGIVYTIDSANTASNVMKTIQTDQPELFAVLFGTTGTNITSGKTDRVIGVIEKMFSDTKTH